MRAIAYLSHALAMRQAPTPSPALSPSTNINLPLLTNATCGPNVGTPGSVYICGQDSGSCEWWKYSKRTKECRILNGALINPSLVGPDPGGHCHLYKNTGCRDGDEVELLPKPEAPLPAQKNLK